MYDFPPRIAVKAEIDAQGIHLGVTPAWKWKHLECFGGQKESPLRKKSNIAFVGQLKNQTSINKL